MGSAANSYAQLDTLTYEGFDFQLFYDNLVDDVTPPPGDATSAIWYSYDEDQNADGSGAGFSGGWFAAFPFAVVDTIDADLDGFNENTVLGANSWFSPFAVASNWLMTPSYVIRTGDSLYWKSAPRQTPRYMDGYKVKISTTTNDDLAFSTTLFTAAENISLGSDTTYSTFGFSTGFVHGADGTYIEATDGSATAAHRGELHPFAISLAAYVGQTVFFAFHHDSDDDFLISIDDFMIRRGADPLGVTEVTKDELGLNVFPNPAADNAQVNYNLAASSNVTITIYDVTGKVVASENKGSQSAGRHFHMMNTAEMANGFYTVTVQTNNGRFNTKMIVK